MVVEVAHKDREKLFGGREHFVGSHFPSFGQKSV